QFEYVHDELKDLFSITDFVVSRAGANAIYEFLAMRLPMLLIPLSLAASRGDQIDNAKSFKQQGFADVLFEEELNGERFLEATNKLASKQILIKEQMQKQKRTKIKEKLVQRIQKMKKQNLKMKKQQNQL